MADMNVPEKPPLFLWEKNTSSLQQVQIPEISMFSSGIPQAMRRALLISERFAFFFEEAEQVQMFLNILSKRFSMPLYEKR